MDEKLPAVVQDGKEEITTVQSVSIELTEKQKEFKAMEISALYILNSNLKPKDARNHADVMTILLYGREIGIPPMEAIKRIHLVKGKPEPDYTILLAKVYRECPGSEIIILTPPEMQLEVCTIEAHRPGYQAQQFQYTIKEARTAGLVRKDSAWITRPKVMLRKAAIRDAVKFMWADIVISRPPEALQTTETKTFEQRLVNPAPRPKIIAQRPLHQTPQEADRKRELIRQLKTVEEAENHDSGGH